MAKKQHDLLVAERMKRKAEFQDAFDKAQTPHELIMAWSRYTGQLEALLDAYEIQTK